MPPNLGKNLARCGVGSRMTPDDRCAPPPEMALALRLMDEESTGAGLTPSSEESWWEVDAFPTEVARDRPIEHAAQDELDFISLAQPVAELIDRVDTPFTLAINGPWGSARPHS